VQNSTKHNISVCSIVKNEANNLAQMIESVIDFVDEIIITDTGSTDNTIEIAQKYNAKIFEYKWDNNFSNARNYCISKATKNWILSLDADETLIVNNDFKYKLDNENHVYMINIKNILDNGNEFINCQSTKLFPNFQDFKFYGAVHEYIHREKPYTKSIINEIEINHNGYNVRSQEKKERNLIILIKELDNYIKKDDYYKHLLYLIAKEYLITGNYNKGIDYYKQYINTNPDFNQSNFINALTDMIKVFYISKDWDSINIYAEKYNNLLINSPDFCIYYGLYLSDILKNYQKAIFYYQKAIFNKKIQGINYSLSSIDYKPNLLIGINYIELKKPEIAVNYIKKAIEVKKDYNTLYNLVLAYSFFDKSLGKNIIEKYSDILTKNEIIYLNQLVS
jgi:glycosyltransferase involved in cell wall biosynthesis